MGNNTSTTSSHGTAPQMLSKHSARRKYRAVFKKCVQEYRDHNCTTPAKAAQCSDSCRDDEGQEINDNVKSSVSNEGIQSQSLVVVVRKRPIFAREMAPPRSEFDVVSLLAEPDDTQRRIAVHDFRMASDMKTMKVQHSTFAFDAVLSDTCTNETAFEQSACRSLVIDSCQGKVSSATILLFGQTGSGKTYTCNALMTLAAATIEKQCSFPVLVSSFEIGSNCSDLLEPNTTIKLLEGSQGAVKAYNAAIVECHSALELVAIIKKAQTARCSRRTKSNPDGSSRTHGVYQIGVNRGANRLMFVDLAGSEFRSDSELHSAELRRQCAVINTSLSCLKDCIRLRAIQLNSDAVSDERRQSRIPFRDSKLTMLLRDCFTSSTSRLTAILTVSPLSCDTEHIMNTLRHGALLHASSNSVNVSEPIVLSASSLTTERSSSLKNSEANPDRWSHEHLKAWMGRLRKGKYAKNCEKLSMSVDGKKMSRVGIVQATQWFAGDRVAAQYVIDAFRKAKSNHREMVEQERRSRVAATTS